MNKFKGKSFDFPVNAEIQRGKQESRKAGKQVQAPLALDFGLAAFGVENSQQWKAYGEYLYHAGAIDKRGKARISERVLEEESAEGFELDRIRRFRYRTRYFTDSGVLGSKAFVLATYEVFKDRFYASRERVPKRVKGATTGKFLRSFF